MASPISTLCGTVLAANPTSSTLVFQRRLRKKTQIMPSNSISIIGSGNMASAIGALALKGGNAVEVIGRDAAKAKELAAALGGGATAGTWGAPPAGDIVILAVLFDGAVPIVSQYGDALAGKIIVDITNPFNSTNTGLAVPDDTSIAQMVAKAAPASARVVKAFNTIFRDVLAAGGPLDVFMAGDDERAKKSVSAFIKSLGLRPWDAGDLTMAHWLEGAGLLSVGLAGHGAGSNFSLGVNLG
jgi:8-hydroxy-5-deazaflavin:NADPH oxidoreductase